MKYTVSVAVDGRLDFEIEADSIGQAEEMAIKEAGAMDWNRMDSWNAYLDRIEDENGNFVDY